MGFIEIVRRDARKASMTYKSELMKEVGDCAWFIAGIADCFGFTLEEVMQQNLDKLASRRERGVIDGNGDNR